MYWNKTYECMPRELLTQLQSERLQQMILRIYDNVPFYRNKLQEAGIDPYGIKGVEDLAFLPFTQKSDLRDNYPYGLFAEPLSKIVRIHASSGTTGKPTVVGYTRNDINMWSEITARGLTCAGADRDSVIQNSYGYGLFTGGMGIHYGAERIGASIVPMSGGNTQKQLMLMEDFGTTHLTCTPSYASFLGDALIHSDIDRSKLTLRHGIFGAEPWSENMRREIERKLGIKAHDIYGLSEICGPGVGIECAEQNGLHIWEDHFFPEIINPETDQPAAEGEYGELVITTLTKEGIPLLRYRTHDITRFITEPCPCGRTHRKIARLAGRSDDMLIIRGVNVFPTQIESALLDVGDVAPEYQLIVRREGILDTLEIKVELSERFDLDTINALETLEKRIKKRINSIIGISAKIVLVEPGSLPRTEGKAKRVIDLREV